MPSAPRHEVVPRRNRGAGSHPVAPTLPPADVPQVLGRAGARRLPVAHLVEVKFETLPTHGADDPG